MEKVKLNQNESIEQFLDQLEHLPDLSKEELADLSEKVKNHQKKKIIPRK
jgi:hypothetical protein